MGWILRKTLGAATVTQHIRTSTTPESSTHITIDQSITGGLKGTTENRTLDWQYRPHSDWLFGDVRGRSHFTTLAAVQEEAKSKGDKAIEEDAAYLAEGWLDESREGEVIETYVKNEDKGWTAWQVWGFAE